MIQSHWNSCKRVNFPLLMLLRFAKLRRHFRSFSRNGPKPPEDIHTNVKISIAGETNLFLLENYLRNATSSNWRPLGKN